MSDEWLDLIRDPVPWTAPQPLPGPVETDRLVIRTYAHGDGPRLFRAISADRAALTRWMPWARTDHQQESDSIYYAERSRRKVAQPGCTDFPLGIFERNTGEQLGGTGLHDIETGLRQAEIGYWVRGDRQKQGICTEAVGALISSALSATKSNGWGLRRIVILNAAQNTGSRRVCERLGLRMEMRAKEARYLAAESGRAADGYQDMFGFAVLADEWDFERHRALNDIAWVD